MAWHPPFLWGFSGSFLKILACITMVMDHFAASFMIAYSHVHPFKHYQTEIYEVLRNLGRIAFPVFIFLLIEGLYHTKNAGKYALRLLLFALISEIPFDLAFSKKFFTMSKQNIYWTLLIGFLSCYAIKRMKEEYEKAFPKKKKTAVYAVLLIPALTIGALACGLAGWMRVDYKMAGVQAILAAFLLRPIPVLQALVIPLILLQSSNREWYAFLAVIPLLYYNGLRGRQIRYLFYIFYPLHLLLLYLLMYFTGLC